MTDITVITVVSVLLFHALTVILFQVFSCYIWSAVLTVILFHLFCCFAVLLFCCFAVLLFCCFTDSIPMIIVKKIQIPNIFYRFSKKYYYCTDFPKNIITVTISIQSVQIYQDFGKNTSTCTKKWYFLINEFQKNTIFTPIFVYFLY